LAGSNRIFAGQASSGLVVAGATLAAVVHPMECEMVLYSHSRSD